MGTQKNPFNETGLLSNQNIYVKTVEQENIYNFYAQSYEVVKIQILFTDTFKSKSCLKQEGLWARE